MGRSSILMAALPALLLLTTRAVGAEYLARTLDEIPIELPMLDPPPRRASSFGMAQADTIWVGYVSGSRSPSNPYGVGVGGVWNFDSETAGTDSTQFWSFYLADWRFESTTALPDPIDRPTWYLDHGNEVNIGNTNLWLDRENRGMHAQNTGPAHTAGYLRTGITGYWHVDDMSGVSSPIAGTTSAWCGLRGPSDFSYLDPVTGKPLNGDLARRWTFGASDISGSWPGYGNQIDQILYHDFPLAMGDGLDILSFRFRTDLCDLPATDNNGSAWFNPDPSTMTNFVPDPIDSLMVWVGLPRDDVYDGNKRWLSEVLDFASSTQPAKLFGQHGKAPLVGSDSTVTVALPAWGAGAIVRVAFQVKSNREFSDETYGLHGFDSIEGAALIDEVKLNSALIGDFESSDMIRPRFSLPGGGAKIENSPFAFWITTGKPPAGFGHIHNVYDLPYDDPCGGLGTPDRLCDLIDNTVVTSNHDDPEHAFFRESWVGAESPTIDLSPGGPLKAAGVGDVDHDAFLLEYQLWTGTMDLDQAVFFNAGAGYYGPTSLQQADELVPGWSDNITGPFISYQPDPECMIIDLHTSLDRHLPPISEIDSLKIFVWTQTRCARFSATTLCGRPEGGYFDNIRAGFTADRLPVLLVAQYDLLADTFPFNEQVTPGTADFDTTTALIKQALNNAASSGGEGVIVGDSLAVYSPYVSHMGQPTRVDLVFRILPGPGNYSVRGDRSSPLLQLPSVPHVNATPGDGSFWGQYLADAGPFGKGTHTGGLWDPHTWNSARMDSADNGNISPLIDRELGIPIVDEWEGTYHEEDPKGGTGMPLAITKNLCFLLDPYGSVNELNTCCSATDCAGAPFYETWPPSVYPSGTPTETQERTKILPDGLFTPGTHVEYFMRRADAPDGFTNWALLPDTTSCGPQLGMRNHADGQRFLEIDVFPDMWKDERFGGDGLACMLVVDGADGRGQEYVVLGTLDSLGYGKNNGAGRGWWENDPSTSNPWPNDPDNWVYPNLGQKGLVFDWFDIQAANYGEAGRPGCRMDDNYPPELEDRQCKQGPTPEMLKAYYNTILWMCGDLSYGCILGGPTEQPDDAELLRDFLVTSSSGQERVVWLAGDGSATNLVLYNTAPELLADQFAVVLESSSYQEASGNITGRSAIINLIPDFQSHDSYGLTNTCQLSFDVVSVNSSVPGGLLAQRYEDSSDGDASINPGAYGAAVYRPADNVSRFYTTLLTGYGLPRLKGLGFENTNTGFGRIEFVDDVLSVFNLCAAIGPVIAVGDLPGAGGAALNFVRGAFPNPSVSGEAAVRFDLARPSKVTIRFYNVAGRLVHEAKIDGVAGPNTYRWDGATSTGIRMASGVYFYRLSAPGFEFENNSQRLVILESGR